MKVLVPIDGSDWSARALRFGAEFARRYEATVHVVHFSERRDEQARDLLDEAESTLSAEGVEYETELITDVRMSDFKAATRVGTAILGLVDDRDFDHIVMGHHGSGRIEGFVVGSAAERVVEDTPIPVTIVP
jgi:nucleotide-binding universal stress UspA family protein